MYDVAIIGAGPAGYNAALKAAELGLKTALIEKGEAGGTCLNRGCIPTKCLLKFAHLYRQVSDGEKLGVSCENLSYNLSDIYGHKNKVVEKLRKGVELLIRKSGVDFVQGEATFVDNHTLDVNGREIKALYIIIAIGSVPAHLAVAGGEHALDSDKVLADPVDGNDILIVGGGVIGLEFASFYADLGKNVTILEYAPKILPKVDNDAVSAFIMQFKKKGVKIYTDAKVTGIKKNEKYEVWAIVNGSEKAFTADFVISAVGRETEIASLRLDRTDVALKDGKIVVDETFRTAVKNIYCIGDAGSGIKLAHYAEAQGVAVAERIAGKGTFDLNCVPGVVYTSPEIAWAGRCDGEDLISGKAYFIANGKACAEDETAGFVKTVINAEGVITGGTIVGDKASELIAEIALAVVNKLTAQDIIRTIHPHPSFSEAVRLSALDAEKHREE
ncbi:MAG TPA: dihydrolipoyl dehydrogenase [Clostridia bacterium]|nr:dihydrolipoyl dehydrogenase [Clostridia bacterium]